MANDIVIDADMAASARPTADCVARHATLDPETLRPLAEELAIENDLSRRRFVHHTRPRGPLTLHEAQKLCERMKRGAAMSCYITAKAFDAKR